MMSAPHLLHVFPTFAVGGSQIRFARLVEAHGAHYRHSVVALDGVTDMLARLGAAAPVTSVPVKFDKRAGLRNLPLFRSVVRELAPAALVTYNWGAVEWALANRFRPLARHIHIEDGFGPEESTRQLPRRVWARRLALSGRHTRIVLPSRRLETLARDHWKLPAGRIVYLPNGVDCGRFTPSARRSGDPVMIGTIATLRREKNLVRLIDAVVAVAREPGMPPMQLTIYGDGPERHSLAERIRSLAAESIVRLAGPTRTPEAAHTTFDIFALSSDTEQMPLSVLEAMACGLPVVSPDVGDVLDMVAPENRPFVTARDDEPAFRASLRRLVTEPPLRARLGAANVAVARDRFDEQAMIARWREIFGQAAPSAP